MTERNSPMFAAGITDGAADARRRPAERRGFDPARIGSWMYRRGFARAFLAVRRADPALIAQLDAALGHAWEVIEVLDLTKDPAP